MTKPIQPTPTESLLLTVLFSFLVLDARLQTLEKENQQLQAKNQAFKVKQAHRREQWRRGTHNYKAKDPETYLAKKRAYSVRHKY